MTLEEGARIALDSLLSAVGIRSLDEWDILRYLADHPLGPIGPDHLAHQVGQELAGTGPVLVWLEGLGLVAHSAGPAGSSLYQFVTPTSRSRREALAQLLLLDRGRAGRAFLERSLPQVYPQPAEPAA